MKSYQVWLNRDKNGPVDSYEYDIDYAKIPEELYVLRKSNASDWSSPGEFVGSLTDDGDHVKIKLEGKKIKLEYNELQQLLVLLFVHNNDNIDIKEVVTVKQL